MVNQIRDANDCDIIESMNEAFDNGNFYGLEYVLDEWLVKSPASANQNTVEWLDFVDIID